MVPNWTKPFIDYLMHGILPDDPTEARKVKVKAPQLGLRDT